MMGEISDPEPIFRYDFQVFKQFYILIVKYIKKEERFIFKFIFQVYLHHINLNNS